MDIDQQVLAAYQVEHKEHLLGIRALLAELAGNESPDPARGLEEAFRMAHSLKGGARVCDLRPAVELGHGLETVFSRLRDCSLSWDADVVGKINVVLDGIEDWMVALFETKAPPEPTEALQAIEHLLTTVDTTTTPADSAEDSLQQQLRTSFRSEYRTYTDGLRALFSTQPSALGTDPDVWEEPIRLAHNLWASAKAADQRGVEQLGRCLERLLGRMRDAAVSLDDETCAAVAAALDAIDHEVTSMSPGQSPAENERAITAMEVRLDMLGRTPRETAPKRISHDKQPQSAPVLERQLETVRLRADSLDRILQSSGRLLTESSRQDQVTRELAELRRTIELMVRERESIRRVAGDSLQRFSNAPEFRHLARYFESVDQQVHLLAKSSRQLALRQQRSAWLLGACGRQIQADIRKARMVSAESLFQGFPKMVRDLARDAGKQIEFKFVGADVPADRMVLQALKDPVMHMLRNAVIHGIEPPAQRLAQGKPEQACVSLVVKSVGNQLHIRVEDDGRGLNLHKVAEVAAKRRDGAVPDGQQLSTEKLSRLIFEPGFSTCDTVNELAGRGMGLSVVYETVKRLQGNVQLVEKPGPGTAFSITVPVSVCSHRLLLVSDADQTFAIPLHAIQRLLRMRRSELKMLEGKPFVLYQKQPIPLVSLAQLLGLDAAVHSPVGGVLQVLLLNSGSRRMAVSVQAFLAERDLLVQQLDAAASRGEFFGAVLLEDGRPSLVLNPAPLLERACPVLDFATTDSTAPAARANRAPCVLVVDDSFTTRTLEKSILEAHGYQVHVAMDGMEALAKLRCGEYDLVISDLEMPRLDGFGLLEEMKKQPKFSAVPVILVTSRDRLEDQQRGLELGADAYIIKRKFDHQDLLSTIQQVL